MQPVIESGKKTGEEDNEKDSNAEQYKAVNSDSSIVLFQRQQFDIRALFHLLLSISFRYESDFLTVSIFTDY